MLYAFDVWGKGEQEARSIMQNAVLNPQQTDHSTRYAAYNKYQAVCTMQHITNSGQHVVWSMEHAACSMQQQAVGSVQSTSLLGNCYNRHRRLKYRKKTVLFPKGTTATNVRISD